MTATIADRAAFLHDPQIQALLAALKAGGEEARIAGGAVRDALLGREGGDVDIATTTLPAETIRRAEEAGFRTIPTGIDHGTITVLAGSRPIEVTTLRADVDTDGRRATVSFGRDWQADAERRDFTINGLYAEADGTVIDLVGGLADLDKRLLRFIGDPEQRIREDYLRILRFFRFFAWYGSGRPDAEGLKACARLKDGLSRLSAERVWSELRRLLGAPDPSRALLWMRQAGVLTNVLPESEKWGIDTIHGLIGWESAQGEAPDPLLRLEAIVPPDAARLEAMADRLRMSKIEANRLQAWAASAPVKPDIGGAELDQRLYREEPGGILDRLKLSAAQAFARQDEAEGKALLGHLGQAKTWQRPSFPITGRDLMSLGHQPGPRLGAKLAALEEAWITSGFTLSRDDLLQRAATDAG